MSPCPRCGSEHHFICTWDENAFQALKAEAQMSDFKVGDVVRFREDQRGQLYFGHLMDRDLVVSKAACEGDEMARVELKGVRGCFYSSRLELVSRPSDPLAAPKPALRLGDRIVTSKGTSGVLLGDSDMPGFRWRVNLGGPGQVPYETNLREREVMPAPALKVGDRVRRRAAPHDIGVVIETGAPSNHDPLCEGIRVRVESTRATWHCCSRRDVELLPPEPTQAKPPMRADEFHLLRQPKPYEGSIYDKVVKPMTATAARILARNQTDPMRDPEYTHEMEAKLKTLCDELSAGMSLSGVWKVNPSVVPCDGWMPAGTYMPLKERAVERDRRLAEKLIDRATTKILMDESSPGIAKSIPHYERRFSSRVATWDPMDDTFLEDAE